MLSETVNELEIEEEGTLRWKKSVVIRGVYKSPPKGRGRVGRARGRGRGRRGTRRGLLSKTDSTGTVNSSDKNLTQRNSDDGADKENTKDSNDVPSDPGHNNNEEGGSRAMNLTADEFLIFGNSSPDDGSSNELGENC